jgi:hypothetical protein
VNYVFSNPDAPGSHPNWRDPEAYTWMAGLPRTAWAWEFLRRNPDYRTAHDAHITVALQSNEPEHQDALPWGLLRFEDPARDVRVADVYPCASGRLSLISLLEIAVRRVAR